MRTTLTIDDALAAELKELAHREGISFKEAVNRALAIGLRGGRSRPRKRYRATTHAMGTPRVPLDDALSLASDLEDEETARKLELRK